MQIRNQKRFVRWGLNAAAVIAYGERYGFSHMLKGALVTLAVNNSSNLEDISRNSLELFKNKAWLSQVIKQVAEMACNCFHVWGQSISGFQLLRYKLAFVMQDII